MEHIYNKNDKKFKYTNLKKGINSIKYELYNYYQRITNYILNNYFLFTLNNRKNSFFFSKCIC